jgi:hypothetical protein
MALWPAAGFRLLIEGDEVGECAAGINADEPVCHANRPSIVSADHQAVN